MRALQRPRIAMTALLAAAALALCAGGGEAASSASETASPCTDSLAQLCSGARRVSASSCLVCCGQHQAQLQKAQCNNPTIHAWCSSEPAPPGNDLFHPGAVMTDTDGTVIRAHQPHVYYSENGSAYHLIGSSHVGASDGTAGIVNMYSSDNLHSWSLVGGVYNHTADSRPSLLGRNPRTGLFVMWAKGNSFQSATAPSLLGPYTNAGNYRPDASCTAGDSASFLDPVSGKAYMVYSQHTCGGENARAMKLLMLNDDWTAPAVGAAGRPVSTVEGHLEAPCPFYSALTKKHYIWASQTSGWTPNPAHLLVSSNGMGGTWRDLHNPSKNSTTFGTQGSHIEKLPGPDPPGVERFLYVGDRYEPYITTVEGSRYIFLALEVHADGKVVLFPDRPWGLGDEWPTLGPDTTSIILQ
jgi:hypothetical protein